MKASHLKLIVLTIALAATAQSVQRAYAQTLTASMYEVYNADARTAELLRKKALIEAQGGQLSVEESKILIDSMRQSYEQLKSSMPNFVEKTDAPTV